MNFTRKQVLEAINNEPLRGGNFVHLNWTSVEGVCPVCAVGAVLRNVGYPDTEITSIAARITKFNSRSPLKGLPVTNSDHVYLSNTNVLIRKMLNKKRYLNALSIKFEELYEAYGGFESESIVVDKLSNWVKRNIPVKFKA